MDQVYQCIYCLEHKPNDAFNTDHVVQTQLGTFNTDALTLHSREVCFDCNSYFGTAPENIFALDSFEAFLRFELGVKLSSKERALARKAGRFTVAEGEFAGALVKIVTRPGQKGTRLEMLPQVGLRHKLEDRFKYFEEHEFVSLPESDVSKRQVSVIAPDAPSRSRLLQLVLTRVPDFNPSIDRVARFAESTVELDLRITFDKVLARVVAKIAFNLDLTINQAALSL